MNKTLITKAKKIAVRVHENQVDKNNYPYMAHILDVASRVSHLGEPFEIVGLLHDAIEDADPEEFKKEIIKPLREWQRFEIRLTVDNPEDLILCRQVYQALYDNNPHIPVQAILNWIDENPEAHKIVEPFVEADSHWLR